jgi:GTP-binding protein
VVALSKLDLTETRESYPTWREKFAARGITLHAVSAATGEGVKELLEVLWPLVRPPAV